MCFLFCEWVVLYYGEFFFLRDRIGMWLLIKFVCFTSNLKWCCYVPKVFCCLFLYFFDKRGAVNLLFCLLFFLYFFVFFKCVVVFFVLMAKHCVCLGWKHALCVLSLCSCYCILNCFAFCCRCLLWFCFQIRFILAFLRSRLIIFFFPLLVKFLKEKYTVSICFWHDSLQFRCCTDNNCSVQSVKVCLDTKIK